MAWRNVNIPELGLAELVDMTIATNKSIPGISTQTNPRIDFTNATKIDNWANNSTLYFCNNKIKVITSISPSDSSEYRYDLYVNDVLVYKNRTHYLNYTNETYLFAVVDDENHIGAIGQYEHNNRMGWWSEGAPRDGYNFGNSNNFTENIYNVLVGAEPLPAITSNGGGATHIAKVTGQLKDLSSNLSDILMVSGGGGGGYLVGENAYAGADAGGISGSGNNSGNQSSGYAFGQGESGTNESGGGSGLYGGTKNGASSTIIMNSWCKTTDYNNHRQSSHRHNFTVNFNTDVVSELSSYLGSDYILEYLGDNPSGGMYSQIPITYDGDNNVFYSSVYNKHIALPIKSGIGKIVKLAFSYTNKSSGTYAWIQVGLLKINGNTTTTLKYAQYSSTGNYELTLDTPSEADYLWICNAEDLFEISNMTMYVQASIMNEAGAGSGYIGNSLVNNKKMIGYNVPTSDAEGTKTESVNDVSANPVSGKPKSGNGFARIKFLRDS